VGYLYLAIVAEVLATSMLKASQGFTRLPAAVVAVTGYIVAFYSLSLSLRAGVSLGVAYAIWSGVGIVLLALIGVLVYRERVDAGAVAGFILIVAGVVVLNLFSNAVRR